MEKNKVQKTDPAEICECNPEWSSNLAGEELDECRCSYIVPVKSDSDQKKKDA